MSTRGKPAPRRVVALATALLAAAVLAGCSTSTKGAQVSCTLSACTATFERGVDATASVLGIRMKLVAVDANEVTVDVGGSQVVVPVGGSQRAGGLSVSVDKVTDKQVVLKVAKA